MGINPPWELAYDATAKALAGQLTYLDTLRTQAGVLLGAVSISTSFLGSRTLEGKGQSSFGVLAIICFVLTVALCIRAVWPPPGGFQGFHEIDVVNRMEHAPPPASWHRELAVTMACHFKTNEKKLGRVRLMVGWAGILLVAEVLFFGLDLLSK